MKCSRFVCTIFASATLAVLMPAQTQPSQDNSDPKQWTLSNLDKPVSELLGFPRWFRIGGQYRARLEDDSALGFVPGASDTYYLERFRLDMYIVPTPWLTFKAEMQDSRNFLYGKRPLAANTYDPFDLREAYVEVEGPKGAVGCYMKADGTANPERMKWRSPSFINLGALPLMARGWKIADVIAIFGSIDINMGEVDR